MEAEVPLRRGWVEPALRGGVPRARRSCSPRSRRSPGRSPRGLKERLRHLSDVTHGARALTQRREPIASAYRIFFRQIGIDPEEFRPPAEAAMLERLRAGRFRSRNTLDDALTVAVVETGVAVRAFDADRIQGELGLRHLAAARRSSAATGSSCRTGTIVIADERHAVALDLRRHRAGARACRPTRARIALCAVQVAGVPDISVEEALWICSDILTSS